MVGHVGRGLVVLAALYLTALTARYWFPPYIPRYQVESACMILAAIGLVSVMTRRGSRAAESVAERPTYWTIAIVAPFLVGAAFLLYAPALRIGLLSDDFVIADWARRGELVHYAATGFVRPAVPLFWTALDALPGPLAAAVHGANIALHAINAVLVIVVARRFRLPAFEAMIAGVLFLASGGLSEAVVWASGVQDVLMTSLCLGAVVLATIEPRPKLWAAVAVSVCALMAKETAVIIPALVALVLWGRGRQAGWTHERRVVAVLALVGAAYVVVRLAWGVPSSFLAVNDWRYFFKQFGAGLFATLVAPWSDIWGRAHPLPAVVRGVVITALLAVAFLVWRRHDRQFRVSVASAAWTLAAVAPVFSLFYVGPNLDGSRYVYLAAAGFAILLAALLETASAYAPRGIRKAAVTAVAAVLCVPAVPAIESDIRRWQVAAIVREEILSHARSSTRLAECGTVTAEGIADNVDGAYVFRHGLREALGLVPTVGTASCRVSWTGRELIIDHE